VLNKNQSQIITVDTRSLPVRAGLVALIFFALIFGWFAITRQLGNMLAELTSPTDSNAAELAALSKKLAPSDPLTSWLTASAAGQTFAPANGENPLDDYKETVRLSPFDYRWWIELARAYEQADNAELAEQSYKRAIEIAPAYTYPRWQLGNFYLRQNRSDEAFAELKNAAQKNPVYRMQVFSVIWDFYGQDTTRLEQIAGELPEVKTTLVQFYAGKGRAEDSLRIWNTLSDEEKKEASPFARVVAQSLYEKKFFRSAIGFVSSLGIEPKAKPETVQNGGFEDPISYSDYIYFGWKIAPNEKMEINLDGAQKSEGARSLRVTFKGYNDPHLNNIYQTVVINPGETYTLSFRLKTENLKSAGTPVLDIVNTKDDKIIAASKPFPAGTNDWQEVKIEFTAPAGSEAVSLRTARVFCGDACPLVGTFWYDDFRLVKK
jgi:tetratricopeptide (TPR) repeat protein